MELKKFKIDHSLFEDIEFDTAEKAEDSAEKLCLFLIKNTDRREVSIGMSVYGTDSGETQWWHHKMMNGKLEIERSDY